MTKDRAVKLHICAAREHVPKNERTIRTTKERARSVCHSLPFNRFTKIMTKCLAYFVVRCINAFPSPTGLMGNYSPANIIEGKADPDYNRNRIPFGHYAIAYHCTANTMMKRSSPCIALDESNEIDGYYFMSIETGKKFILESGKNCP